MITQGDGRRPSPERAHIEGRSELGEWSGQTLRENTQESLERGHQRGKEAALVEGSEAAGLSMKRVFKIPVFLNKCVTALNDLVRKELAVLHQGEAVVSFRWFGRV